jgi:glutamyl-tRNA reductase
MTTQFPEDPLTHIKTWQAKFKEHKQECGVAEMDTPGATKDSREGLHTTINATDSIKDWRSFWKDVLDEQGAHVYPENELKQAIQKQLTMAKQKTVDNFLEEICCALEEMNGEEVFNCFVEAVQSQFDYTKKEHDKTSELLDLLTGLK